MEYASFLRNHIEEIISLSDAEFEHVLTYFSFREVPKKEYLIHGGQTVNAEYFVVKGLLKAFTYDDAGKEYIVQFAMENWWVSDYMAYQIQGKGEIFVQALETCVVLELSMENKNTMCEQIPKMALFHGKKAFNGFVALQKRILSLMKNSAGEKYDLLLEQYPALFQRVSKTTIAHYLGVSRETLSRLTK